MTSVLKRESFASHDVFELNNYDIFKDSMLHKGRQNVVKLVKENRMNELKNEFMTYCQQGDSYSLTHSLIH